MNLIKPKRLVPNDMVALLSPSWGGPSRFPHVFDLGIKNLISKFDLRVKEFPTARMDAEVTYQNPRLRAEDINAAFTDPEVAAIITSIGGDDSVRILPFLDLELILQNPKIFMGFSDTAAINCFLNSKGLITYNGPSNMAGFAQLDNVSPGATDHIREILFEAPDKYPFQPYPEWSDKYISWDTAGYSGETSEKISNSEGWHWLQGSGIVQGRLFGGCIEVLEFLKGTQFWPDHDFLRGSILFFETSEDKPTVSSVKYFLRNYGSMGLLDSIGGILFGRARSYSEAEKIELDKMIVQIVAGEFGRSDMPILTNLDFGHTDPQWIMPLGVKAEVDCKNKSLSLCEAPTT